MRRCEYIERKTPSENILEFLKHFPYRSHHKLFLDHPVYTCHLSTCYMYYTCYLSTCYLLVIYVLAIYSYHLSTWYLSTCYLSLAIYLLDIFLFVIYLLAIYLLAIYLLAIYISIYLVHKIIKACSNIMLKFQKTFLMPYKNALFGQ